MQPDEGKLSQERHKEGSSLLQDCDRMASCDRDGFFLITLITTQQRFGSESDNPR